MANLRLRDASFTAHSEVEVNASVISITDFLNSGDTFPSRLATPNELYFRESDWPLRPGFPYVIVCRGELVGFCSDIPADADDDSMNAMVSRINSYELD